MAEGNWDQTQSQMYRFWINIQKEAYHHSQNLSPISRRILCDGVGLGKTFVGLLLIERLIMKRRKNGRVVCA